jgi:WD40 repeat protein
MARHKSPDPASGPEGPAQDFFVTVAAADPDRVSWALAERAELERYPEWGQRSDPAFLMRLGENLFRLAFPTEGTVADLAAALGVAVAAGATLRLWLHAPSAGLALLPWEYLCLTAPAVKACRGQGVRLRKYQRGTRLPDRRSFLALHPHVSLVRQTSPAPPAAELERIGALRVLVAWANPDTSVWPPIQGIEAEAASIRHALIRLPRTHAEVRVLVHATRAELEPQLREWRPHVLHFAGHGGFPGAPDDPGDLTAPSLVLEGKHTPARRRHDYLTAADLRALCAECGVQIVVLNCCWGARTSSHFTGVAQSLTAAGVGRPVPVVVAHQFPVTQGAAAGFSGPFYRDLALASPVEDAVRAFRDAARAGPFAHGAPDWGVPAVFLGVRQSLLFRSERVDPYPLNFGEIIREHVPIVGRDFLRAEVARFQRERAGGIFLLTAPPGMGKTAFLAQWAEDAQPAHFFYRTTVGMTDPDECVKSLYHVLLGRLGAPEQGAADSPVELHRRLEALLDQVSARCERLGTQEVVLIDALDEAGPAASDRKSAVEVLPARIPAHVYFLITSRPGPAASKLVQRPDVVRFDLDPASDDNHRDAVAFCLRELDGRISDADGDELRSLAERLARWAKGNFLVLKLSLSKESLGEQPDVSCVERAAEGLCGSVEKEYEKFFERVAGRLADRREESRLFYRVLGAFASARAPVTAEQVMAAFGLDRADWDWAFGQISQFLERGGVRQEERGAQTYRLYHETFREYLRSRLAGDLPGCHRCWADHAAGWRDLRGYARLYALRHLPAHLIAAGEGPEPPWDRLCDVLTDFAFLQAKIGAAGPPQPRGAPATIFDLLRDFLDALAAFPADHPRREEIQLLCDILNKNSHTLKDDPTLLLQQVVNAQEWDRTAPGRLSAKVHEAEQLLKRPWLRLLNRSDRIPARALLRTLTGHVHSVRYVAFNRNGSVLASADDEGVVRLWDARTGEQQRLLMRHSGQVACVAFSPGGGALASGGHDGVVRLWDAETGEQLRALVGHYGVVRSVAFSPDNRTLASGGGHGAVRLWDARTGEQLRKLEGHHGQVDCVAFSPGGRTLASGGFDGEVRLWDAETGRQLRELGGHRQSVLCVAFSPGGGTLASGGVDGVVWLWDARTGERLRKLEEHHDLTGGVAFSPDSRTLASGGFDGEVRLWDAETGRQLRELGGHRQSVLCVAFSPGGDALASGGEDWNVRLWDIRAGGPLCALRDLGRVACVAFSPGGALASGGHDGVVRLWDAETAEQLRTLEGHSGRVACVAFSPGGRTLASGGFDGEVRLWDARTGEQLRKLEEHHGQVDCVAFSPAGQVLASGDEDGEVLLWDVRTGRQLRELWGHSGRVDCVAFSPAGTTLASCGEDWTVRLWDARTGRQLGGLRGQLRGHREWVNCVAFSPDGAALASGDEDGEVKLWDARTGRELPALGGHSDAVDLVTFSPDSRVLAICCRDGTVELWDPQTGQLLTWLPCTDVVLALCWDSTLPRLYCADAGGVTGRPGVSILELVRP